MTTITVSPEPLFTRTDLTPYETICLHSAEKLVAEHSFAVGAFVMRSASKELREEAAELYLDMLEAFVEDCSIRTEAFGYALAMARYSAADYHGSQAHRLREEFLVMLYQNVIADRESAVKAGA